MTLNLKRKLALILGILFLWVGFFSLNMGMNLDGSEPMANCPYQEDMSLMCDMSGVDHLSLWKQLFTGTLFFLAIGTLALFQLWKEPLQTLKLPNSFFKKRNALLQVYNFLLLCLARGILHPKLYEPARS